MFTREEVDGLLKEPKYTDNDLVDLRSTKIILVLHSRGDDKLKFRLHINRSKKIQIKLTCHHDFESVGLLRLDFYGRHRNPEGINERVPAFLHKYAGKDFGYNDHHIHVYVEGSDLEWAIPIVDHDFPIKQIAGIGDIVNAIMNFQIEINLETKLRFNLATICRR